MPPRHGGFSRASLPAGRIRGAWTVFPLQHAPLVRGDIRPRALECASGLTTVVLVTAASATGRHALSLEQGARFEARLAPALPRRKPALA